MTTIDTVVIGAGHAGLAVSKLLTDAGREHVVLDRGRIGHRWRTERWDSLHLLTPSWMTRLPGWSYRGPDPDGYLSVGSFIGYLEAYAASFGAPVVGRDRPCRRSPPRPAADPARRYRVVTSRGTWHARHVVIATGPHGTPHVPAGLAGLDTSRCRPAHLEQLPQPRPARAGRRPRRGRVGVRPADRRRAQPGRSRGHPRGRATHPDAPAAPRPGHLLVAREHRPAGPDHRRGGRPGGRARGDLAAARRAATTPSGPPRTSTSAASRRTASASSDGSTPSRVVRPASATTSRPPSAPPTPPCTGSSTASTASSSASAWPVSCGTARGPVPCRREPAPARLDLRAEGIGTVLVAAGYRPHHPWLRLPITDPDGTVRQHRGVTPAEGVYVVGQRFQHRRDSGHIDGARHDAAAVVAHLLAAERARGRQPLESGTGRQEPAA